MCFTSWNKCGKNKHEVWLESRPLCIPRQRSAICGSGFHLTRWGYVGSAWGLGCEAQFLWLQTKPRTETPFPRRSFLDVWLLSSLCSVSPRFCPRNHESKMGFFSTAIAVVSRKYLRVSLRYSEASFWWDQAMFGHECGFGRRDVNEWEWELTELNAWGRRADAVDGFGQTSEANVTIQV